MPIDLNQIDPGAGAKASTPEVNEPGDQSSFLGRTMEAGKQAFNAVKTQPKQAGIGAAKAVAGGIVSLGGLAAQGITDIVKIAKGKAEGKNFMDIDLNHDVETSINEMVQKISGVNLAPEGKEQEAMGNLLAVLPDAISSAGDTVFEKTGSALAGAGTQALLTLLTLKPGVVGKVLEPMKKVGKGEKVSAVAQTVADNLHAAVDELAVRNPEGADALVEHVRISDEDLGDHLGKRVKRAKASTPEKEEIIGKTRAQAMEAPLFKKVGETPSGKPRVRSMSVEEVEALTHDGVREGYDVLASKPKVPEGTEDPVMYFDSGQPTTRTSVESAFRIGSAVTDKIPGVGVLKGKLSEYYEQSIRIVNPEALGPEAKVAAAVLAKNIAGQMQKDSSFFHRAVERRNFWNHRVEEGQSFIKGFEKGEKFSDPMVNKAADAYRRWNEDLYNHDKALGIEYEPVDNYLYHVFEDGDKVAAYFEGKFGPKWKDPKFTKDRSFSLYEQALKNGFKPKYGNPEDIMLARQHASDLAETRVQTLNDLEQFGLARKVSKGEGHPTDFPSVEWRSPNGNRYWVHEKASAVLHNAFNTKSLWEMKGMGGDAFRGAMALKNTMVPLKLGFSLFHPLHIQTIDNATAMVRASKELLSGQMNPAKWMAEMGKAAMYKGLLDNPKSGYRVMKAYQGRIDEAKLTGADRQALQYMAEGGMIPEMSVQFKTKARQNFTDAVQRRSLTALWHGPFAALSLMQKPMFEVWIPSLKIASYLQDVKTALKVKPELAGDTQARLLAFRKIAKSVDNRYGEMAYNTLFMDRMVKDLAVANTLSLGWQMGFIREYGGGMMDIGQGLAQEGSIVKKAKSGMLDRPLFVTFYTTQALAYGGLLTWALTGQDPKDLFDYVFPKNGEKDAKGNDERVNTMFYTREFGSVYKHMQNEGVVSGLGHLVASKSSGLIGMVGEWAKGVNSYGQEIRDPDAPAYKKLEQTLAATLLDLEPISFAASQKSDWTLKGTTMAVAGFTKAPKFVTEPKTEAAIKSAYQTYYAPKQTAYEKARFSKDSRALRDAYDKGDMEKYGEVAEKIQDTYGLTVKEQRNLEKNVMRGVDPSVAMFARLSWQQQKKILDQMTDEERDTYLPHSNREHLRFNYEAPEESK